MLQRRPLLTQLLGALRLVPDRRILEFSQDFLESLALALIVKGTP